MNCHAIDTFSHGSSSSDVRAADRIFLQFTTQGNAIDSASHFRLPWFRHEQGAESFHDDSDDAFQEGDDDNRDQQDKDQANHFTLIVSVQRRDN